MLGCSDDWRGRVGSLAVLAFEGGGDLAALFDVPATFGVLMTPVALEGESSKDASVSSSTS